MLDTLTGWINNEWTPAQRIWATLMPALIALAYLVVGLVVFSIRCAYKGVPQDKETLSRGASVLVGFYLRHYFFWIIRPLWLVLLRSGIPATAVTALAALFSVAAGVAVAGGRFAIGGWLFLGAGILDIMDGRIARAHKTDSQAGAALDSVLDRYADSVMLIGLSWYYRDSWVLLAVLAAFMGTSLVPYVRARGEGLGVLLRGGVMQRPERVVILGGSVALSPIVDALFSTYDPHPMHWLAVGGVIVVAVGSNVTALHRLRDLLRALSPEVQLRRRMPVHILGLNIVAAVVATCIDLGAVLLMVELGELSPALATAIGCGLGALINYTFNRVITFRSRQKVGPQISRYVLVSTVGALLNTGVVALFAHHPQLPYLLAWWMARGLVYFIWNFPLQRDYVFGDSVPAPANVDRDLVAG